MDWQVRVDSRGKQRCSDGATVRIGFDYEFNSLQFKEDELSVAFSSLTAGGNTSTTPSRWTIKPILMTFAPIILKLVRVSFFLAFWRACRNHPVIQPLPFGNAERLRAAKRILDRIGDQLIIERKSDLLQELSYGVKEREGTSGKDLLTLLVRANLQDADGMSDSDVRARKCSPMLPPLLITSVFQRSAPSSLPAMKRPVPPCRGPCSGCVKI